MFAGFRTGSEFGYQKRHVVQQTSVFGSFPPEFLEVGGSSGYVQDRKDLRFESSREGILVFEIIHITCGSTAVYYHLSQFSVR
jgi:hypothetical protein